MATDAYILVRIPFKSVQEDDYVYLERQPVEVVENTIPLDSRLGIAESLAQSDKFHEEIVWQVVDAVEKDG